MAFDVGAVIGRLEMNIGGWKKSIETVKKDQQSLSGFALRHEEQIKRLGKTMTIAGGAIVASLGAMVKKTADYGDKINDLSQRTGVATTILSGYKLAADNSGTSIDGLATGFKFLSQKMVDAHSGGKESVAMFKALGIEVTNADGSLRDSNDVMQDVAERFSTMEDGAQKTALAVDIFGRSGMELIPFLNLGKKGLQENYEAAQKFGGVISKEAAKACDEFNDSLGNMKASIGGATREIGMALMPTVKELIEKVTGIVVKFREWAKENPGLTEGLSKVALGAGALLSTLGPVLIALPSVVKWVTALKKISATPIVIIVSIAIPVLTKAVADFRKEFRNMQDAMKESGASGAESFFEGINSGIRKVVLGIKDSNIVLSEANSKALLYAAEGGRGMHDILLKEKEAADGLGNAFSTLGIKTKTELTAELKAAQTALDDLRKSGEATPGGLKVLHDKIADLKEQLSGVAAKTTAWIDYLKTQSLTTIKEKTDRVNDLWKVLGQLDKAYKDGKLTLEDYTKGAKSARDEMFSLGAETDKKVLPATRDLSGVLEAARPKFNDVAYAAWTFEGALKEVADQAMVSEATVLQFLWNVRADFLQTIGIIIPKWGDISEKSREVTTESKGYFDGLFVDIAQGFGNTIKTWMTGATTFADFLKGLWGNIKDAFFTMVGEMITKWVVEFLTDTLLSKTAETVSGVGKTFSDMAKSVGSSITGVATGTINTIANVVTAATSIFSLFKKGPDFSGIERILGLIWEEVHNHYDFFRLNYFSEFHFLNAQTDDIKNAAWAIRDNTRSMAEYLKGLKGAASGAVSTQTELMVVHGTRSDPEYIMRASQMPAMAPVGVTRGAGVMNISIPIYLGTEKIDERMLRIADGRVEWLHSQYQRGNRMIPTRAVGGA